MFSDSSAGKGGEGVAEKELREVFLRIEGLDGPTPVARLHLLLSAIQGVEHFDIDGDNARARVVFHPDQTGTEAIRAVVDHAGFPSIVLPSRRRRVTVVSEVRQIASLPQKYRFIVGLVFGFIVIAMSNWPVDFWGREVFAGALATFVLFYAAESFLINAVRRPGTLWPGMDGVVILSATAAYGWSLGVAAAPGFWSSGTQLPALFFDVVVILINLLMIGRFIERRTRRESLASAQELAAAQVTTARRVRAGVEEEVPLKDIVAGDIIQMLPGLRIPVDGAVMFGGGKLDVSLLTGDSEPIPVNPGDHVVAGSLNVSGAFQYHAAHQGGESLIDQVAAGVRRKRSEERPMSRSAEWLLSGYFIFLLTVIATTLIYGWQVGTLPTLVDGSLLGISAIVLGVPAGLVVATPLVVLLAQARGRALGLRFRSGESLMRVADLTRLVLNKTGTLTEGTPRIYEVESFGAMPKSRMLAFAASAEMGSGHPYGRAIVELAEDWEVDFDEPDYFSILEGFGVECSVGGDSILVGNLSLMTERGVLLGVHRPQIDVLASVGRTPVLVARNSKLIGMFAVGDKLKPKAAGSLKALGNMGIESVVITADSKNVTQRLCQRLGVTTFFAETLPEQKLGAVEALTQESDGVGALGNSEQDAPSLATAHVGFATSSSSILTKHAADVVLEGEELTGVLNALGVARLARRLIRQNLFYAAIFHLITLPFMFAVVYDGPDFRLYMNAYMFMYPLLFSILVILLNVFRMRWFSSIDIPEVEEEQVARVNAPIKPSTRKPGLSL